MLYEVITCSVVDQRCSILTGGPGCGKTTTTRVIVALLKAMHQRVMLTAPTGRAAQRMGEVIGLEAKTIHRLLEFQGTGFKRGEENPLETDFLIIDESSMLDISLTASLLKAGIASNFTLYLIPCGVLVFLYSSLRFMHRLIWFELLFLSFLGIDYVFQTTTPHVVLPEFASLSIHYLNLCLVFLSLGWMTYTYQLLSSTSSIHTAPSPSIEIDLTDHLTGLFKRETVLKRIDEILTTISHNKQTMSIIILDIDNAADIKKQFGNATLDSVLIHMAEVLQAAIRHNDRASRWGGNEFMLLLPGGNKGSALRISERIKKQLSTQPLYINNHQVLLSLSFGIAEMGVGEDFNACLIRSEKALKIAKQGTDGNIHVSAFCANPTS